MKPDILFIVSVDYKEFTFTVAEDATDFAIQAYRHQADNNYTISIKLVPAKITLQD